MDKKKFTAELMSFVWLIAAVILIRGTVFEPFHIPSASMVPTLLISDHILISKLSYGLRLSGLRQTLVTWRAPERGHVVVFFREDDPTTPEDESSNHYVKRVIAVAGDTVSVDSVAQAVLVNGKKIDEPYARWTLGGVLEGNFAQVTVPEGKVFLLGDNRDNSRDSRFWSDPFVDVKDIKGKAFIIYWTWTKDFFKRWGKIVR
jgi:signal peptidase I